MRRKAECIAQETEESLQRSAFDQGLAQPALPQRRDEGMMRATSMRQQHADDQESGEAHQTLLPWSSAPAPLRTTYAGATMQSGLDELMYTNRNGTNFGCQV